MSLALMEGRKKILLRWALLVRTISRLRGMKPNSTDAHSRPSAPRRNLLCYAWERTAAYVPTSDHRFLSAAGRQLKV
jgi:hypothetical protein